MRGFGITGVDFAIECHMDKVAHAVGIDPIEFRILNAYRDGDMKAHRRLAKNTALIECCQVAAEKAQWPLSREALAATSLRGGGGERAAVPARTATDRNGEVQGFDAGSYANSKRKPREPAPAAPTPPRMPVSRERPGRRLARATNGWSRRAPSSRPTSRRASPDPTADPPGPGPRGRSAPRFSSISGLRRR